ncbi:curli-like amyloid fiber formation chaperone CsgH [Pelagibacterium lacus]|uniref:CsgH-like domain-containing protein n=1 Tax=Pelagibacterium lacus TaxID=2282655 RepID=A0A369W839_9HYPH|nr:curli-like amyloid fiber formation chaperone CsgH [Pelagibacterium lacus]RDE09422.1 hypothetical protein DVH29_06345 [Pelagibacterium lacus]
MVRSILFGGLVALGALALAGAAAASGASGPGGGLVCGIDTSTERGLITISGVAHSPIALSGQYSLALESRGSGGSANISQGGAFALDPGAVGTLGEVTVNAGASVTIAFTITSQGRQVDCSAPIARAA